MNTQPANTFVKHRPTYFLLSFLVVLIYGVAQIVFGEKIPVSNGLGWDGAIYGAIAKDFEQLLTTHGLSWYYIQRSLPSGIIHYTLRALGLPLQDTFIIRAFEIYNLALLLLAVIIWGLIAKELRIKDRTTWLGFLLVFGNFAIARSNFYYPVLTDTTAFFLGILLAYCFLKQQQLVVLLICVIGSFVWLPFFVFGAILFIFPFAPLAGKPARLKLDFILAVMACIVFGVLSIYFLVWDQVNTPYAVLFRQHIQYQWIAVTLALNLACVFIVSRHLLNNDGLFNLSSLLTRKTLGRLTLIALSFVVLQASVYALADQNASPPITTSDLVRTSILSSAAMPLTSPLSHILYAGPLILLVALAFRDFSREIHRLGIGTTFFVALYLFLMINSQSRLAIQSLPFFAIGVVKVFDDFEWTPPDFLTIGTLAFILSKIWLPLTHYGSDGIYDSGYYLSYGPWMSPRQYLVQGIVVVIFALCIYWRFRPHLKQITPLA